jgi:hypothetical protein
MQGGGEGDGGQGGEVAQSMYTHMNKCENNKKNYHAVKVTGRMYNSITFSTCSGMCSQALGCISVVRCLPSMCEALGSIPDNAGKNLPPNRNV